MREDLFRRDAFVERHLGSTGEDERGVAGQQLLQAEDQNRDEEQRRDDRRYALNEVVEHDRWQLQYRVATSASSPRKRGPIFTFCGSNLDSRFRGNDES